MSTMEQKELFDPDEYDPEGTDPSPDEIEVGAAEARRLRGEFWDVPEVSTIYLRELEL